MNAIRLAQVRLLTVGAIVLLGCDTSQRQNPRTQGSEDTTGSWPTAAIAAEAAAREADTIFSDTTLDLYNERHRLTITGIGSGGRNFDRSYRIRLTNASGPVLDTVFTKFSFADSLDRDFLAASGLYLLEFDFVRAQSLYFNAMIGVDESDNVQPFGLLITYAGPKKGRMLYWSWPDDQSDQDQVGEM